MPHTFTLNPSPAKFRHGRQIAAGRALLRWSRNDLAHAARIHARTVAYWEGKDNHPRREPYACALMRKALLAAGVATVCTPGAGVVLVPPSQRPAAPSDGDAEQCAPLPPPLISGSAIAPPVIGKLTRLDILQDGPATDDNREAVLNAG